MANSLYEELNGIETELIIVQSELETLLQKQEQLLERKEELKSQIDSLENSRLQDKNAELRSIDWEEGEFPWTPNVFTTLKSTFKIDKFRPLQASCINATLSNKDTILIMPTGSGKSLCYQLPAVLSPGLTLVVSPLVSLMEDQLLAVKTLGIESSTLNASTSREDTNRIFTEMTKKDCTLKILYVTPEKISKSKRFMSKLEKTYEIGCLSRVVIDEVHCTSEWGHDFRPDFKILGILKRQFPNVPILGLTATATAKVLEDVKKILALKECLVFRGSYNRANLIYEVRMKKSTHKAQMETLSALIKRKFPAKSGIVYCFSRKDTEEVALDLCQQNIKAACYHADLPASQRSRVHMKWLNNSVQVIVATIAFGMGIDKPDVRFVIHHSISKSMENYYQESGRAGRDGQSAHCIIFFRAADTFRQSTMVFTEHTGLRNLYAMLRYCLNKAECRRAVIARSFGEKWTESDCNRSCDICSLHPQADSHHDAVSTSSPDSIKEQGSHLTTPGPLNRKVYVLTNEDVTDDCKTLLDIVESNRGKEKRLTALKAIELWRNKSKQSSLSVEDCEHILLHAIVEDILAEDFHFTPYSTISYLKLGHNAEAVKRNLRRVIVKKRTLDSGTTSKSGVPMHKECTKLTTESVAGSKQSVRRNPANQGSVSSTSYSAVKVLTNTSKQSGSPVLKKLPPRAKINSQKTSSRVNHDGDVKVNSEATATKRKLPQMLTSSASSSLLSIDPDFVLPVKKKRTNRTSNDSGIASSDVHDVIEIESD